MIPTLFAKVKAEAFFLVLLAVAAVGAWLYVQYRQVSADRDDLQHRAELICAGSGTDFAAMGKTARGVRCAEKVAGLVKFKGDSDQLAAATLAQALADHDARQNDDNQAARAAAEAASSAARRPGRHPSGRTQPRRRVRGRQRHKAVAAPARRRHRRHDDDRT
ncbi:hypothetical protein [Sphingomonas aurantiaca]|uniref:hypothetical protein n=1 Tax=Sphingomonas aurantiaca TaxID=185949 RepID=UPI00334CB69A